MKQWKLWVAFLLLRWLVYLCSARMLNHTTRDRNLSREQIMKIRLSTVMNRWLGNDGTETRFKKVLK
jgi:hypothetical protein